MDNININELTGQASFFSANGQPAWHRLGQVLDSPLTAEEAIVQAGLDFEVEKQDLFLADGRKAKDVYATVRTDTEQQLGVVGNRYEVLQNKDAFAFFDPIIDRQEAIYETGGALGDGEKIWVMAKLPERFTIAGNDDEIETYVVLLNTHNRTEPVTAFTTHIRVVCENTMSAALHGTTNKVTVRHTASMKDQLAAAHEIMGITDQLSKELEIIWNEMAKKEITDNFMNQFLDEILPLPEPSEEEEKTKRAPRVLRYREELKQSVLNGAGQDMPGVRDTAWGLYNGTTFWLDHVKNYRNGDSGRLNGIWLGTGADMRQKAFNSIVEFTFG